jgi:hypothetical protein
MADGLQLVVSGAGLDDEARTEIARELRRWIMDNAEDVRVEEPAAKPPRPGQKGIETLAGALALFLTGGAAKALIDCIATYVKERRPSVKLEVSDASGAKVSISADNVGRADLDHLITRVNAMTKPRTPRTKSG